MNRDNPKGSVHIHTLGCAKNEVDSQKMAALLQQAGYLIASDPEDADVIIINTCSFIQPATEESIDAVLDACALSAVERGDSAVVVAGCMPARYGTQLEEELPEPRAFVPCADEGDIADVVARVMSDIGCKVHDLSDVREGDIPDARTFEYVKISDGCDRFCTYCTIPFIRGRYRSFPLEDINRDVRLAIDGGAREVVLIAQDTGRWGADLEPPRSLSWLLDELARTYPDTWFRVMYIQPDGVTDDLLDVMASHDNIASYLDIPLQHVDADILRAMNRSGSLERFRSLAQKARKKIDGVVLRTTLIAGFPGETEDQFDELVEFAGSGCFDYVGVFPYSQEEGTRAGAMESQLDDEEKMYRAQCVRDAADAAGAVAVAGLVGSVQRVLVEGREEDGQLYGRTMQQAPEVDGITFVDAGIPGQVVTAVIEDSLLYDMEGSVMDVG